MAIKRVEVWVNKLPEVGDVLVKRALKIEAMKAEHLAMGRLITKERVALEASARKLWTRVEIREAFKAVNEDVK